MDVKKCLIVKAFDRTQLIKIYGTMTKQNMK